MPVQSTELVRALAQQTELAPEAVVVKANKAPDMCLPTHTPAA